VKNTRVAGHTLISEGAAHDDSGRRIGYSVPFGTAGRGKCSCGTLSEPLPSTGARKRWHRDVHKPERSSE
jgi:hypothetical protein